jgi:stage III sporulation protein AG
VTKWLTWVEQKLNSMIGPQRKSHSPRWLLILFLVGLALMLLHSFVTVQEVRTIQQNDLPSSSHVPLKSTFQHGEAPEDNQKFKMYEQAYQNELKTILQNIMGIEDVDVMVTIESTEELVLEKNIQESHKSTQEKDAKQTSRQITETTRNGQVVIYQISGNQQPIIVKMIKPKIRGVIVIARGAEQLILKKMVVEAVEKGLDVAPHRICVLPRKTSESKTSW